MNNIRNSVMLIGHLGQDPEIRHLQSGQSVVNFSLATNKKWKNADGEKQQRTDWHRCNAWGKLAEIISQYGQKGQQVAVRGELTYNEWTDDNGSKRKTAEITVEEFSILTSERANTAQPSARKQEAARKDSPASNAVAADDDLPF